MAANRRKRAAGQTIGGMLVGFEQQVFRTLPPGDELVHHARPDEPVPAGDGTLLTVTFPDRLEPPGESGGDASGDGRRG